MSDAYNRVQFLKFILAPINFAPWCFNEFMAMPMIVIPSLRGTKAMWSFQLFNFNGS